MNRLNHVAFIMDGNGRWGKKRGKGRNYGHLKGVETVKKIVSSSIKKNIPILVFSGTHDPVGAMGKGTRKLHQCLIENECKSELYLVDGARHETLNETNRIPTYNYILKFLISHLKGA